MYDIVFGHPPKGQACLSIDSIKSLKLPAHLRVLIPDREQRFKLYLEECFHSDPELLVHLCHAHDQAKTTGKLYLKCDCSNSYSRLQHCQMVENFIVDHQTQLDNITPYVFEAQHTSRVCFDRRQTTV